MDPIQFTAARAQRPDLKDPEERGTVKDETVRHLQEGADWRLRSVKGCRRCRRREEFAARNAARKFEAQVARLFVVPGEV